jgi:hypothetical protein
MAVLLSLLCRRGRSELAEWLKERVRGIEGVGSNDSSMTLPFVEADAVAVRLSE